VVFYALFTRSKWTTSEGEYWYNYGVTKHLGYNDSEYDISFLDEKLIRQDFKLHFNEIRDILYTEISNDEYYKIVELFRKDDEIVDLLNKLGLYEKEWVPYENVVKIKSNDKTLLVKEVFGKWLWYNKKHFDKIPGFVEEKKQLISILNPVEGRVEVKIK
jgi:hypothetical protein